MRRITRDEHLFGSGPKRILTLDGGGLRGILTLAFLDRIEAALRKRHHNDQLTLSDYFDLIGGTSTGSIIAAFLSLGYSVERVDELYRKLGEQIFKKMPWRFGLFSPKFEATPLKNALRSELGDITLGAEDLKTGLAIVAKRLDTGSPWVLHNNPKGKYFNPPDDDPDAFPNRDFPLRDVIRASCAAPHYFEPERINIARGVDGAFIDGSVSPWNNPSLLMLMIATMEGYGLSWPMGQNKLLLVSCGSGFQETRFSPEEVMKMTSALVFMRALGSIVNDCDMLNQTMMQWIAYSPNASEIDSEMGNLTGDAMGPEKLATYLRYDVDMDADWLNTNLGLQLTHEEASRLYAMDNHENFDILKDIGERAADLQVHADHFDAAFDTVQMRGKDRTS